MQALGSYEGRRMLFLGLGTGLGSALIVDGVLEPTELAHLPYRKGKTYEDYVGERALERAGKKKWRKHVCDVIELLKTALQADYVVVGGGNVDKLGKLPPGARPGSNANTFVGGFRLWEKAHLDGASPKAEHFLRHRHHPVGLEAELLLQLLQRRRGAERLHPDDAPHVARRIAPSRSSRPARRRRAP